MRRAALLFALALLLSGCVQLPTEKECVNINDKEVLDGAGWGEVIVTDETYVLSTKIGCWHSVALADAARNDPQAAVAHCRKILDLRSQYPDDEDTLRSEFNTCIDAVAKRFRLEAICVNIDKTQYPFENERCVAHATPPPAMCASPFIVLAALLFCARSAGAGKR